jgi:RNA ligase (TIGR02306 family)
MCYVTEKVDGSSGTYFINNGEFGVCSRNLELLEDEDNSFWKVARELDIENKLRSLNGNFAIQGELLGEGIQSNKLKFRGQTMLFFNAFDIDGHKFLSFDQFIELTNKLELPTVPIVSTDYELENDINSIIKMATIKSKILPEVWAEGIVIRPLKETSYSLLLNETLDTGRLSFKAINPEFLLKYGE